MTLVDNLLTNVSSSSSLFSSQVACALNAKNKVLVREAGGIPVIIACMHAHMSSAKLLQRACGVLWNVTCNVSRQREKDERRTERATRSNAR